MKYFQSKCNLIFIDGGHTYEVVSNDILKMKSFANESYNRVIIDDALNPEIRMAIDQNINSKIFVKLNEVIVNQTLCLRSQTKTSGAEKGMELMYRDDVSCPFGIDSDYVQDSIVIGTYLNTKERKNTKENKSKKEKGKKEKKNKIKKNKKEKEKKSI